MFYNISRYSKLEFSGYVSIQGEYYGSASSNTMNNDLMPKDCIILFQPNPTSKYLFMMCNILGELSNTNHERQFFLM